MALSLSLPRMEGTDLRPWVPPEHSLVISSARSPLRAGAAGGPPGAGVDDGIPASFLAMEWHAAAGLAQQKLQARCPSFQSMSVHAFRPTVVYSVAYAEKLLSGLPMPPATCGVTA